VDSLQQRPDLLAAHLVHLGMDGVWATRFRLQARIESVSFELAQHIADRLVVAAEQLSDSRHPLATRARQQDLAPTHLVQVPRMQPGFQPFLLMVAQ